jgi:hypothetical protein
MVDPGCSGGGFDDVQDLHEQRVVIVLGSMGGANVDERTENNTAKGCVSAEGKGGSRAS